MTEKETSEARRAVRWCCVSGGANKLELTCGRFQLSSPGFSEDYALEKLLEARNGESWLRALTAY